MRYKRVIPTVAGAQGMFGGQGNFVGFVFVDALYELNERATGTMHLVERATGKSWSLSAGLWSGEVLNLPNPPGRPPKNKG